MKATEMQILKPYKAVTSSSDRTVHAGQILWVSKNGDLCLPDKYGGGALLKEEWASTYTCDFTVEEAMGYIVEVQPGRELLKYRGNR